MMSDTSAIRVAGRTIDWGTMGALAEAQAQKHGDAQFAEISGRPLTYAELNEKSLLIAQNLISRGIEKGQCVGTLMFNNVEQVLMCFGCARAGVIWVPINAALRGEDLSHTIRDSGIVLLVAENESRAQFEELDAALREHIELIIADDPASSPFSFSQLLSAQNDVMLPECLPSDTGAILYTGGTTGLPKGVLLSQFSFILGGIRYSEVFSVSAGERHFSVMPLFHAGALHWALMGPLVSDMTTVIDRRFSVQNYFDRVCETQANVIDPFGAVVTLLCQQPPSARDSSHKVRISVGVVQNLPDGIPEEFERRFGIPLVSVYGLTEAGGNITSNRLPDRRPGSNGRAHGWAEISIADENDMPLPYGEVGEILLRPTYPHMFSQGYHNAPLETLKSQKNLWLHTGDLGYLDEAGELYYLGRKAHWLRRRGENISAYEIESVMAKYPDIDQVVVVGVRSEIGEDDVKAFVIPKAGAAIDYIALVDWMAPRLAAFKIPRFIEIVAAFPRSATKGEIERSKLKAYSNANAWDREKILGRMSGQARK